jgi:hypothetical protein
MLRNFANLNHDLKKSSQNVTFFHLEASYGYKDEILYQVPIITNQIQSWFDPESESFLDPEPIQDPEPDPGPLFSSSDLRIRALPGPIPDMEPFLDPELGHDPEPDTDPDPGPFSQLI